MKKIFALLLAVVFSLSFVACGNGNDKKTSKSDKQTQTNENVFDNGMGEINNLNKFEQFEKGLSDKGIEFKVNEKAAEMVGAKEGYGYKFDDGTAVELYLFDATTSAYIKAKTNRELTVEGFGTTLDVEFNGDICIYFNGESSYKSEIQNIFNSIR